jgi:hypothetical protein
MNTIDIHLRAVRSRMTPRHTIGLRVVALSVVGVAFFFLVEGNVAVGVVFLLLSGVVTWLAGLWVIPWGIDAYSRRLSHIMRTLNIDLRYEDDHTGAHRDSLQRCIHRVQRLKPPAVWAADHEKHLEALAAYGAALQNCQDVVQGADVDAVERAAAKLSETHSALNSMSQELSAKLRSTWRNPNAASTSATSDSASPGIGS